jgi:hypothetical protein
MQTPYKRLRRAAASIAAISACALSAFALEPPPVFLSSTNFPEWRDSAHLLVVTNYTSSGVKITLYIEKPPPRDVYWTLHLDLYDVSNMVGQLEVGDKILDTWVLELTGAKLMGVKAVQSFTLSVSSNSLPQSTLTFGQRKRVPRNAFEAGNAIAPATVPLRDVVNGATGGFRKGEPIFRRQQ